MTEAHDRPLIAIVDDDEPFRRSMERLVRSAGFRTASYGSAEDFLRQADLDGTACVVLDMKLPGMTGLDLQRRLMNTAHSLPIVFVSAHDDAVLQTAAIRAGAVAFLKKPFEDSGLIEALRRATL